MLHAKALARVVSHLLGLGLLELALLRLEARRLLGCAVVLLGVLLLQLLLLQSLGRCGFAGHVRLCLDGRKVRN